MKVGEIITGNTIDGHPIVGYVTKLHSAGAIRVCLKPGHYVDVDPATAVVI